MTDNLKKNITWNTVGSIAYLACQWLTTVAVVRLSSDFNYAGDLSLAMTISNLFVPIGLYKIRSFQVSDLSCEYSSGEYIGFRLITIVLGFVFVLPYAFFTCQQSSLLPVYFYCIYKSIEVMVDVFHGIDQKAGNMIYCGISMLLRGILSLLAFCAGMHVSHSLVLSIVLMIAVSLPVMVVDVRWASNFDAIVPSFRFKAMSELFYKCLPATVGVFCCAAVTSVSRQELAAALGASMLGVYSSVCSPAAIVQAGAANAYAPLLGAFASASESEDKKAFNTMLVKVILGALVLCILILFACFICGDYLLGLLFGDQIHQYSFLLYGAVISSLITAFIGFFSDLTIVKRKMVGNLVGNLAALIVVVPLSSLMIHLFGPNGTSIAISLAYFVGCVAMLPCIIRNNAVEIR